MDSEKNTNRKGFLKRAGLAFAAVFAVSSTTGATSKGQAQVTSKGAELNAMARVRKAKGAVAHKA